MDGLRSQGMGMFEALDAMAEYAAGGGSPVSEPRADDTATADPLTALSQFNAKMGSR